MLEINDTDYTKTLKGIIAKKSKEIKGGKSQIRNYKIAQYAASRGFESDLIWDILKREDDLF